MHWDMYKDCKLLQVARVPLSLNAVLCFLRVLNWLTVWESIGVISVILLELYSDIKIFVVILALVMLGFSTALLGLMPALNNADPWATDGAFFFPYWAMFGEYGEVTDFASASIYWGSINWAPSSSGATTSSRRCCSSTCSSR